jgi:hypothetical protein
MRHRDCGKQAFQILVLATMGLNSVGCITTGSKEEDSVNEHICGISHVEPMANGLKIFFQRGFKSTGSFENSNGTVAAATYDINDGIPKLRGQGRPFQSTYIPINFGGNRFVVGSGPFSVCSVEAMSDSIEPYLHVEAGNGDLLLPGEGSETIVNIRPKKK